MIGYEWLFFAHSSLKIAYLSR